MLAFLGCGAAGALTGAAYEWWTGASALTWFAALSVACLLTLASLARKACL